MSLTHAVAFRGTGLLLGPGITDDERVVMRMISLDDGAERWTHELPEVAEIEAWTGAGQGQWVRFGSDEAGVLGFAIGRRVVVLDPKTGQARQDVVVGDEGDVIEAVLADGAALYVGMVAADGGRVLRKMDLVRLDEIRWSQSIDYLHGNQDLALAHEVPHRICVAGGIVSYGPAVMREQQAAIGGFSSMARDGCIVIVGSKNNVIDPATGKFSGRAITLFADVAGGEKVSMWPARSESPYLITDDAVVRLSEQEGRGTVMRLDATGRPLWDEPAPGSSFALTPQGIVTTEIGNARLVDRTTGEVRWHEKHRSGRLLSSRLGPVLVLANGWITWLDPADGRQIAQVQHHHRAPMLLGESRQQTLLLFSQPDGDFILTAYDAQGEQLWEHRIDGRQSPVAKGEAVLVTDGVNLSRLR